MLLRVNSVFLGGIVVVTIIRLLYSTSLFDFFTRLLYSTSLFDFFIRLHNHKMISLFPIPTIQFILARTLSGLESFMDSQSMGVRFLMTTIGVLIKTYGTSLNKR